MSEKQVFTADQARSAGERIGIDWSKSRFDVDEFRIGMEVELEHGTRDPETNVTDDDLVTTAKIARAHLNEFPDYYSRLAAIVGRGYMARHTMGSLLQERPHRDHQPEEVLELQAA